MPRVGTYRYLKSEWKRRNRRIWHFLHWWEKRSSDNYQSPLSNAADGLACALNLLMEMHPETIETLDRMERIWTEGANSDA